MVKSVLGSTSLPSPMVHMTGAALGEVVSQSIGLFVSSCHYYAVLGIVCGSSTV